MQAGKDTYRIVLQASSHTLGDVVVTGYQELERRKLTAFDKRGIGTSASAGKEEAKLRFEDYVNDVTGWIDYLSKEKRFTTITVAGHSEGALIGMLACQNRPKVKGYISIAGAGRPAYEIIEAQVTAQQNPEAVRKEVASINGSLKNGKEVSDVPAYLQSLYRASVQPYLISWFKYNPCLLYTSRQLWNIERR